MPVPHSSQAAVFSFLSGAEFLYRGFETSGFEVVIDLRLPAAKIRRSKGTRDDTHQVDIEERLRSGGARD